MRSRLSVDEGNGKRIDSRKYSLYSDFFTCNIEKSILRYLPSDGYENCLVSIVRDSEMENLWHLKVGLHNLGYVDISKPAECMDGISSDVYSFIRWCKKRVPDLSGIVFSDRVGLWSLTGEDSVLVLGGHTFFPGCAARVEDPNGGTRYIDNSSLKHGSIPKLFFKYITVPQYSISSREDNLEIAKKLSLAEDIVGTWRVIDCDERKAVFECTDSLGNKTHFTLVNISIGAKIV